MKMLLRAALVLSVLSCAPAMAATTPVPQCMNAGGASTPCQGAVPIDPATGNPVPPPKPNSDGSLNILHPQPGAANYVQLALAAGVAKQLAPAIAGTNGVVCSAASGNAADVLVGSAGVTTAEDGTGNGYPISPGGAWSEGINSTASLWFVSVQQAVLFCHGN